MAIKIFDLEQLVTEERACEAKWSRKLCAYEIATKAYHQKCYELACEYDANKDVVAKRDAWEAFYKKSNQIDGFIRRSGVREARKKLRMAK